MNLIILRKRQESKAEKWESGTSNLESSISLPVHDEIHHTTLTNQLS